MCMSKANVSQMPRLFSKGTGIRLDALIDEALEISLSKFLFDTLSSINELVGLSQRDTPDSG